MLEQPTTADEHKDHQQTIYGVPHGMDAWLLAQKMAKASSDQSFLHICTDDMELAHLYDMVRFFAPTAEVIVFPAWDCLPFDRVSPNVEILGERVEALTKLCQKQSKPRLVLTTINAITQKIPKPDVFHDNAILAQKGGRLDLKQIQGFLAHNGYNRTDTVREQGEYAIRGGIVDIFPPSEEWPIRLDLFGDEIETIRLFDPMSQCTTEQINEISLGPVSEVIMTDETISRFRQEYREKFGNFRGNDPLYEAIKEGRKYAGMEHWISFFYRDMASLFDYMEQPSISCSAQVEVARHERMIQVKDFYQSRLDGMEMEKKLSAAAYKPAPMADLYISKDKWDASLSQYNVEVFDPFAAVEGAVDAGGRKARNFADARAQNGAEAMGIVKSYLDEKRQSGKQVVIACYSQGARERMQHMLAEQGLKQTELVGTWQAANDLPSKLISLVILGLENGFETDDFLFLTEQDILGDRLTRPTAKKRKSKNFLADTNSLDKGDYVVHEEHGIGQFEDLETVTVTGIPHDCVKILYSGGDRLFVPVENLDVLSRYGGADAGAILDKLGGAGWQARKVKIKKDLMIMAEGLLKIAAARVLRKTEKVTPPLAEYERFCSGFPYMETEDQQNAIEDVIEDLNKGQAMDRLVCGDVGFGKTEVALRGAFVAAMAGYQVAVVAPTTLLARQHYQNFITRFKDFPIRIIQLSRLVTPAEAKRAKEEIQSGNANIIIGTHALLSKNIKFNNLGMLIVDEEQKFGVKQKERLKELQENVHVLTLTATPIPRTLQMSLTGVKNLSLMATPPVDRLAVRTFILPSDQVVLREAMMREHYRGGQSFYVCPRVSDLAELEENLKIWVPELKVIVVHGQMPANVIEDRVSAFYDGQYDVLLATNIIESGIDIPNVNTMIIHRSEMFGLAQLYQLRGRIGRSKIRGYAYLTYDPAKKLSKTAMKRLEVLEQLNTLGAGFQLASHDMDIRGAGNLLGEEQSGHIKEVGVELYQQMLEEAVAAARAGGDVEDMQDHWSPQIDVGTAVMIPENYIEDLNLRLNMYRRVSDMASMDDLEQFRIELIDRFGSYPDEVQNLLDIVTIKHDCRLAQIEKIDAGPKGAVITFRHNQCDYVAELLAYIAQNAGVVKLRPEDQKLVFIRSWPDASARVEGVRRILKDLIKLAGK